MSKAKVRMPCRLHDVEEETDFPPNFARGYNQALADVRWLSAESKPALCTWVATGTPYKRSIMSNGLIAAGILLCVLLLGFVMGRASIIDDCVAVGAFANKEVVYTCFPEIKDDGVVGGIEQ